MSEHNFKVGTILNTIYGDARYRVVSPEPDRRGFIRVESAGDPSANLLILPPDHILGVASEPEPELQAVAVFVIVADQEIADQLKKYIASSEKVETPEPISVENQLTAAIENGSTVEIEYTKVGGFPESREVDPESFGVTANGDKLVYAYDHDARGLRSFRLDRISSVEVL